LENNPAKFHPDPIWNDEALGFRRGLSNKNNNKNKNCNKIIGYIGSVADQNLNLYKYMSQNVMVYSDIWPFLKFYKVVVFYITR